MSSGTKVGPGPGDIVLDGDPAPLNKEAHNPQFWSMSFFGQTAGWIRMPLAMEIVLGPGQIVIDGDTVPPPYKRHSSPPTFRPMSVVAKRLGGLRWHLVRS